MTGGHDTFSSTLSLAVHELRTPITVLAGYLRMLLREQGGPLSDKQRKMLEEAERSSSRIASVVNEMSDLRKLASQEFSLAHQPFDLAALLAELASGMHEGGDRGVTLTVRGTDRPVEVIGDRKWMASAVRSVLLATMREGDRAAMLVAECSVLDAAEPAALLAFGDEAAVKALCESGKAGPPPDRQFDEWRGGLGMALPLARRIVEAHGGAVWSVADPNRNPQRPGWSAGSAVRLPLKA
jgi:signal transduction histidine kinase